jgi:2'-5' RNA ligase
MRLFTAIELSDEARGAVAREQERVRQELGAADISWVRPTHIHLTLVFLGEIPDAGVRALLAAMGEPLAFERFEMAFGTIGCFPERGAPRVLWLGVVQGREMVARVQNEIASRAERAGIHSDPRPFHPHLTLGRWRRGSRAARRPRFDASAAVVARAAVEMVTLFSSRLSPAGPTYTALARCPLL